SEYFHHAFQKMGHSVLVPPHQEGLPLDKLFNSLMDRPDMIVFTDHLGEHAFPSGLSGVYGIPKVYYAVDTPINSWWQKSYARLFDYVFTDQRPLSEELSAEGVLSGWLPVAVDVDSYQAEKMEDGNKLYDFAFVGSLDPDRRPKRSRLVERLSSLFTLKTAGSRQEGWISPEESGKLYRQSKLALNESLFPGVTTRMLEAMASGTVLFTEKAGGDLGELFQAGEDFAWFEPEEVLEVAQSWLSDEKRRRRAAKKSLEKVRAGHDVQNRAEKVLTTMKRVHYGHGLVDSDAWDPEGQAMFWTALRWPRDNGQARMMRAGNLLSKAEEAEKISPMGLFMLGHLARMRNDVPKAAAFLTRSFEAGEPRGALGMAIMALAMGNLPESRAWLARFTLRDDVPPPDVNALPTPLVKALGARLMEMGCDVTPGFSRLHNDPAVWNAFEFYQSAFGNDPGDPELARSLAGLLMNRGASAEAMEVAQRGLERNPDDEILGGILAQASKASYLTLN
ncbi:MAG: glycosyltransferase, partial [Deltaproteobacteria bacterium]|nr:glycosyltransferase [Deltaproteobacteria bacterium]